MTVQAVPADAAASYEAFLRIDGADLARQHHLPQPIIDFIEQHHGTTLVEFFYRREAQRLKMTNVDARMSKE